MYGTGPFRPRQNLCRKGFRELGSYSIETLPFSCKLSSSFGPFSSPSHYSSANPTNAMKDSDWHQPESLETLIEINSAASTTDDGPLILPKPERLTFDDERPQEMTKAEAQPSTHRRYFRWILYLFLLDLLVGNIRKALRDRVAPHGMVTYYQQDSLYHRHISAPCGYGILTLTVGPTPHGTLDLWATEFSFYQGWCWTSFDASHARKVPFGNDADPEHIPFGALTRLSKTVRGEPVAMAQAGEYVMIDKGSF